MAVTIGNIRYYSTSELSEMLSVTPTTIRNYLKSGRLNGKKLVKRWFVSDEELKHFLGITGR